jgi:hypothetical protein
MQSKDRKAADLEEARQNAAARFEDLRASLGRELGYAPRGSWWVPVVGFACGLALAGVMRGRRGRS